MHEAHDHEFREVVEQRAGKIIARGGFVVAAGHDHEMLHRFCNRAFWLEGGGVRIRASSPQSGPRT
jgi:ABC-type polysaccharide/polyol phosphate transport system ATPase subunit